MFSYRCADLALSQTISHLGRCSRQRSPSMTKEWHDRARRTNPTRRLTPRRSIELLHSPTTTFQIYT